MPQTPLVVASLGLVLVALLRAVRRRDRAVSGLLVGLLVAVAVNAFATGALSAPVHRYQARIVWLLLLAAALGTDRLFAAGLLALALWLLQYDIARRNIGTQGLTRFIAACLLSGYVWLAVAGLLGLAGAFSPGHPWRDAPLHAIALGFVLAMVFGHAPIIFPAVTRIKIPYHPALYLPLALLHLTLAVRVLGGLADHFALRQYAALTNGLVLLVFIATMVTLVRSKARKGQS